MDDLEKLDKVGPATADKLIDAGYETYDSIAVSSPGELSNDADVGENNAGDIIQSAREKADIGGFESGAEIREKRQERGVLKTFIPKVDELLGGGIKTQSITEFYGEFGAGKSQVTHQLCVNVQVPEEEGGLGRRAIFIDSEDTFRPARINQMVRGLDDDKLSALMESFGLNGDTDDEDALEETVTQVLDNIHVAKALNANHQILLAEKTQEQAREFADTDFPVGVIIVDSLTAHFRAEYVGRGELAERQQKLNKHLHDLQAVAKQSNAATIVTNQVSADPDNFFGDPTTPIGGNILGHTSDYRVYLRKSKNNKRIVKLVDAPELADGEAVLRVNDKGLKPE